MLTIEAKRRLEIGVAARWGENDTHMSEASKVKG